MSDKITIRCRENGPLVLPAAALVILDHQGNPFPIPEGKETVALCRCGHSSRKPFCDGTHRTCGFMAVELGTPPATGG